MDLNLEETLFGLAIFV